MRMKRIASALTLVVALLFSAAAGTQLVNLVVANPINIPPDSSTKPPTVTISSPIVNVDNVSINFKATVGESATATFTRINTVYYITDWNQNKTYVYRYYNFEENVFDTERRTEFSHKLNLTAIPEGNHTITVYANEYGFYEHCGAGFFITGFSSVNFTIDTTPPEVAVMRVENRTGDTTDVPLNFTVNEPTLQIAYSLDGQDNVTINGNTTLTELPNGDHNVTVYATDEFGNTGASETMYFSVDAPEPFPTTLVIASVITAAVVAVVLLVYFKKRRAKSGG
jgi:hypothetical protein